jgi:signal transduction histidine kinase/ActR/RegA family two-component response regulator
MKSVKTSLSTAKRVFLLQAVFIMGFLTIFALEQLYVSLIKELDKASQNERSRLFIGEQMIRDIESIEMSVYRMASTTGNHSFQHLENAIQADVNNLKHSLNVLRNGGSVSQTIHLNLEVSEQMVKTVHYQPESPGKYILEVIELEPLINDINEKIPQFRQLLESKETHRQQSNVEAIANHEQKIRHYIKQIPAFFTRVKENANRLNYDAQQKLTELEQNLIARKSYYETTKYILIFLVVLFVVIVGVVFARQINRINSQLSQTWQEMLLAKEAADQASRAKSDFVSRMSHELRTPLNAIAGFAQLLAMDKLTAQQNEQVKQINHAGKHLLELINQVLDFAKIEAGKFDTEQIPLQLRELLEETISMQKNRIDQKGLALNLNLATDLPNDVLGDPTRLRQVLINLIGNAIKFTDQGSISLSVQAMPDNFIRFEVTDTGIGMNREAQAHLFQAFTQADNSITRRYGGTGLGLMLCKEIVEAQQGHIGVISEEGKGSTFWFELPMPVTQQHGLLDTVSIGDTDASISEHANTAPRTAIPLELATLLLVEDNPINQIIASHFLERLNIKHDIANNGQEALECLARKSYDLVLLDLEMPIMDGYTTIKHIREQENGRNTTGQLTVIAMSANALNEEKQRAFNLGVNDYITKPVNFILLRDMLEKWLMNQPKE